MVCYDMICYVLVCHMMFCSFVLCYILYCRKPSVFKDHVENCLKIDILGGGGWKVGGCFTTQVPSNDLRNTKQLPTKY